MLVPDHLLSHSNSFGFEMEKDAAGCRALNRNFIVGEYGEKTFRTLYRATQKELRRRNLYLLDGTVYFRRRTFFGPLLLVTLIKVCFGASLLYMVVFNYWVGLVLTGVFGMALVGIYTYEERQDEQ